jgi:hypothetical protein
VRRPGTLALDGDHSLSDECFKDGLFRFENILSESFNVKLDCGSNVSQSLLIALAFADNDTL